MATRKCDESIIDNICIVFDLKVTYIAKRGFKMERGEIRAISYKESVWSRNLDLNSPMRHWFQFKFRHVRRLSKGMFIGWEPKFTLSCFSKKATVLGRDCQQYSIRSYRVFCTTFLWKVNSKQKKTDDAYRDNYPIVTGNSTLPTNVMIPSDFMLYLYEVRGCLDYLLSYGLSSNVSKINKKKEQMTRKHGSVTDHAVW